jgi:hypothetical protein
MANLNPLPDSRTIIGKLFLLLKILIQDRFTFEYFKTLYKTSLTALKTNILWLYPHQPFFRLAVQRTTQNAQPYILRPVQLFKDLHLQPFKGIYEFKGQHSGFYDRSLSRCNPLIKRIWEDSHSQAAVSGFHRESEMHCIGWEWKDKRKVLFSCGRGERI